MKVLSVVGARPQFIKEAIVGKEIRKLGMEEVLLHTGQHYDANMSQVFFEQLEMKEPQYNLGIGSGSHAYQTGEGILRMEQVFLEEKPGVVLVYGDTNATVAAALVAAKLKIPIGHVEAGIRQTPKDIPEEINRVITDHISTWLFCPSKLGLENLEKEGLHEKGFFWGDVMFDLFQEMEPTFDGSQILSNQKLEPNEFVLVTIHRDFNTDTPERLEPILKALAMISQKTPVLFPLHPRTKKAIEKFGLESLVKGISLIEPVSYLEMMGLLKECSFLITDSGGLQKEAYFAGKRALVLMEDSGWRELVDAGWNLLCGTDEAEIVRKALQLGKAVPVPQGIYGNGDASEKIASFLQQKFREVPH